MDYSLLRAGRTIHLKIISVAPVCSVVVLLMGINARTADIATTQAQKIGVVVKAGKPAKYAGQEAPEIR